MERLYVGGLAAGITGDELRSRFTGIDEGTAITSVDLMCDSETGELPKRINAQALLIRYSATFLCRLLPWVCVLELLQPSWG
jgi:hypothetical protein